MGKIRPRPSLVALLILVCGTSLSAQFSFVNRTNTLHFANAHSGAPMAIADMDADGLDDIVRLDETNTLIIDYQTPPLDPNFSGSTPLALSGAHWSICIADYNEDGYPDIFTGGAYNGLKLLEATNNGTSYTVNALAGSIFLQGSNFVDIDNDGLVDIFACHDDGLSRPYRNTGTGFVYDISLINAESTVPSDNSGNYGSVWTDYDNDGDLDMYLSKCRLGVSDPGDGRRRNQLFSNNGNNVFTDVAEAAGLLPLGQSWATDFADIDNDGDLDAFVINHDIPDKLYLNNGNGQYTDITGPSGLLPPTTAAGPGIQCRFADFDNDGYVDLLYTSRGGDDALLRNNGDLTFTNYAQFLPLPARMHSAATGDVNDDGFIDIIAGMGNNYNSTGFVPDQLLINNGNSFHHLKVKLEGVQSNRDGIGARLELYGQWGVQVREVRSGESYGIMHSLVQHFGLGSIAGADSLIIRWPSGVVDIIEFPLADQTLTVVEGSSCDVSIDFSVGQINSLTVSFFDDSTVGADSVFWNFGDSQTSNAFNPVHTFPSPGTYTVCLSVFGLCDDGQVCQDITVSCLAPEVIFGVTTSGLTVTLNNQTDNNPNNFVWTFGDGTNSAEANPTHTYTDVGTYNICLLAVNDCGSDSNCTSITIGCGGFTAGFTYTATDLTVELMGQATGAAVAEWNWNLGDGAVTAGQSVTHTFDAPGTYTVCLTTEGSCGTFSSCQDITVTCTTPPLGYSVQFTDLTATLSSTDLSNFNSFVWDFGDGTTSTDTLAMHTYAVPGTYIICLTADSDCETATVCQDITVSCAPPPLGYSALIDELTATFTSTTLDSFDTFSWNFGDGNTSTEAAPVHTYADPGLYPVCLEATHLCGTLVVCDTLSVNCAPPSAGFTVDIDELTITLTDAAGANVTAWLYTFGDGQNSAEANVQYTYDAPGTYTICQFITSECGNNSSCQQVMVTCPPPTVGFSESGDGLTVDFSAVNSADVVTWNWDFGDGNTGTGVTPVHTYAQPGTFVVCLTGTSPCGATETCMEVTVTCAAPEVAIQAQADELTYTFANTDQPGILSYVWTFGDGATSTVATPTYTYATPGNYEVCLSITNVCGTTTMCVDVTASCSAPVANFSYLIDGLQVEVVPDTTVNADTYSWTFGDGTAPVDLLFPNYSYSQPGTYQICLTVADLCGETTTCQTVAVTCVVATADFAFVADELNYDFAYAGNGTPLTYEWSFGADGTSDEAEPDFTFAGPGTYDVCLTITDECGANTTCETITVTCVTPQAEFDFTTDNYQLTLVEAVVADDLSFFWDFGDGNFSNLANPIHTYAATGTYQVCLTVSNACGFTQRCEMVTISCPAPAADFVVANDELDVIFTATDTLGEMYTWTFGDGGMMQGDSVAYTYAAPGQYTVCLTVTNGCGITQDCFPVQVDCAPPQPAFGHITSGGVTEFSDSTDAEVTTWFWTFGDGGSASIATPTHTYAATGTYTVCLTVTTVCGEATVCETIDVMVSPTVALPEAATLRVYPNPTTDHVWIAIAGHHPAALTISLWTMTGQQVDSFAAYAYSDDPQRLELAHLPPGTYLLRFTDGEGHWESMLIKH